MAMRSVRSLALRPLTLPQQTNLTCCSLYHDKPRDKKKIAAMVAAQKAEAATAREKYQPYKEVATLDDIVAAIRNTPSIQNQSPARLSAEIAPKNCAHPFSEKQNKCILCQHNIELDYKNTRLLSQFVSPFSGRMYGSNVTGLCIPMQRRVAQLIKRSRRIGLMPYVQKDPKFVHDPLLFNPFRSKY